jgi:hypothetical protein
LDVISKGLGERDKAGAAPILAIRPLKRLLANHPPEKCSEVPSRIEPSARTLRGIIETTGNGTQFPPNEVFAAMKVQVANLTGHLSKADM